MGKKNTFEKLGLEKNHFVNLSISYLLIYIIFMSTISFAAGGDIMDNQTSIDPVVDSAVIPPVIEEVVLDEEVVSENNITEANPDPVEENVTEENSSQIPQVDTALDNTTVIENATIENQTTVENITNLVNQTVDLDNGTVSNNQSSKTGNETVVENMTIDEPILEAPLIAPITMSLMSEPMFSIQSLVGGVDREGFKTQNGIYNFIGLDEYIPLDIEILNLSHAFIISQNQGKQENLTAASSGDAATLSDDSLVTIYLHNSTHIRVQRYTDSDGPVVVEWQVIEAMDEEFSVQRGEHNVVLSSTTTTATIPNAVTVSEAMSWFYLRTSYTKNNGDVIQFYSDITDPTTITFTREDTTTVTVDFRWEVVSWDMTKINNFKKGYTGGITGDDTSPDCFPIGATIDKSSSIMFHQSAVAGPNADSDGGLDSSTRAGYIQDNNSVCFYDYDGAFTAGVKWYVIDFKDTGGREENIHVNLASTDYVEDIVLSGSYAMDQSLFYVSGTCNGDGAALPRHSQWTYLTGGASATGIHLERTYGGQNREYAWQFLELPYFENTDSPVFSNQAKSDAIVAEGNSVRFSIDVTDLDSISAVNGTVEGVSRVFSKGVGNEWYYDYTCSGDKTVSFSSVEADDLGRPVRSSSQVVTGVSVICDATSPSLNYITPNTPANNSFTGADNFRVDVNIVETNFKNVTFDLFNSVHTNVDSQSYSDGTRTYLFSSLSSGIYYYNVTAYDLAGNKGFLETRKITVDSEAPQIYYDKGTNSDNAIISGNEVFVDVVITDLNFKNVTFNLFGPQGKSNSYTDGTRSVNWNLLPDGDYEYNVTAYDNYDYVNSTSTRSITLDNVNPIVSFESGTENDNSNFNRNYIYVNTSVVETHFKNVTFNLFNSLGSNVGSQTFTSGVRDFNFTGLGDDEYSYNVTSCDVADNCGISETRNIVLDSVAPVVIFGDGTEADNENFTRNYVYVKADVTELYFENITFELFGSQGLVNSTTFSDGTREINFTGLVSQMYEYNVTVYDKSGNKGISSTRRIGLDTLGPSVNFVSPQPKAYGIDTDLSLNVVTSDSISGVDSCWWNIDNGANQSVTCNSPTTFNTTDGAHTVRYFSNDTFSNLGIGQVTFLVSTTGPAIFLSEPINDTFYSIATTVDFNYSAVDPDGVDYCSLYGDWNGGWHLNQTDNSFGLVGDKTDKTCLDEWGFACDANKPALEGDNTFDACPTGLQTDEEVTNIYLSDTEIAGGSEITVICEYDPFTSADDTFIWYYNGTGWRKVFEHINWGSASRVNESVSFNVDSNVGTHWIRCAINYNTGTDTDECMDSGTYNDNDDISFTVVPAKTEGNFTTNLTVEGNYEWNIMCNDSNSYETTALFNNTVAIDFTVPIIGFGPGTKIDNSRVGVPNIFVDVVISENNLANTTFNLYKSGILQESKTQFSGENNYTFSGLAEGTYEYNVTATDKSGRSAYTLTRSIEIDVVKPSGSNSGPSDGFFTNVANQNLTAVVSDAVELKEATLMILNSTGGLVFSSIVGLVGLTTATIGIVYTFLYDDVFSWFYKVEDSVGNQHDTIAYSIEIDTTAPVITFISPTQDSGVVALQDWIYLNVDVYEANYKNVTFNLYKSGSAPLVVPFTDSTRSVNWTSLTDGLYRYNVTSYDLAGNFGVSETRTIILDNVNPIVNFAVNALDNDSVITGSSVSTIVTVEDENEKEILFNLYDESFVPVVVSVPYLDGRRTLTWNNLNQNAIYYYNVTVRDEVDLEGSTETRKVTLDNTAPVIDFGSGTQSDFANASQDYVFINLTVSEVNFANITFTISNQTSVISSQNFTDSTREYNFTSLPDGNYKYNVTVYDRAGQSASTSTRNIKLDTVAPVVNFVAPTENDLVVRNRDWIYANVTVVEDDFKEIKFELFTDGGEIVESQVFTDSTREYNFTGLSDGNYKYNVTVNDYSANADATATRNIGLDSAGPIVNIVNPKAKTYGYNTSIPLENTVSDTVSNIDSCWWNIDNGANQSITCNSATTFNTTVAQHTINMYANDTFGNIGQDTVTFFISITGPAIQLGTPINDTFYGLASSVDFSFIANDPDGVDSCSLYGDWNGGWQKNETYVGDWLDVGFSHRRDIIVNNVGGSTLTDYPAYLNITSDYTYSGDYNDLQFFEGSCSVPGAALSYEVESYDLESAAVWVKIPSLPTSGATICVYYGNLDAENIQDAVAVWSSSYTSVYHLEETSGNAADVLGNFNAESGISPDSNRDVEGIVGGADYFDGTDYLGTNPEWNVDGAHTYCTWVKFAIGHQGTILEDGGLTDGTGLGVTSTGELRYAEAYNNIHNVIDSGQSYADDNWHYVCGGHTGTNQFLYVDGALISSVVQGDGLSGADDARIGQANGANPVFDDSLAHSFIGSLDELRVSSIDRSADWINQSYSQIANSGAVTNYQSVENFTAFSVSMSEEGNYKWNVECNDTVGYVSQAIDNYTFIIDVTDPSVFFGVGTKADNENVGASNIYVDVNLIENNFENITFDLYNNSGFKIDTSSYTDDTRNHNFTGLSDGVYYYNVTVYDRASHKGISPTRKIGLDTMAPSGSLSSPSDNSFVNNVLQNLTGIFTDSTGLLNATLYVFNEAGTMIYTSFVELGSALSATVGIVYNFATEGIYKWFYSVEDVVGNVYNTSNNTLNVDLTAPLIDYSIGVSPSGSMFERENIFVNVTSSDWLMDNITFNLYNGEGNVFSHTPGGNEINWTFLADDTYYYNVTANDVAGNSNSTETRNITLDNLDPVIDFGTGTYPNGAFKSGDTVSFDVLITEPNEDEVVFFLYNSSNDLIRETHVSAGSRSIAWNLLPEGTYYYNATVYDLIGHEASTATRSMILDNTLPVVNYGFGTEENNSYVNQNYVYVKASVAEDNFKNITFILSNETSIVGSYTFSDTTREYNFTGLSNAVYNYTVTSADKAGNIGTTVIRKITLDSIYPLISFDSGTEATGVNRNRDWIYSDILVSEINEANVTFTLSDINGIINQTTYSNGERSINWTNLASKIYSYNVTIVDLAGNVNSTEVRTIGLDTIGPSISILNPRAKAYGYNESLPLDYVVTDAIGGNDKCWYNIDLGVNTTVDCSSSTTFNATNGQHTLHFYANDTFGNTNYKNVTFLLSIYGPAVQLIEPVDNVFYSAAEEVFFNFTAEDPDVTDTCSLYGSWNGGWHLNQTETEMGVLEIGSQFEDFELGVGGFTHGSYGGGIDQWNRNIVESAYDGTASFKLGDTGTGEYVNNVGAYLQTPVYDFYGGATFSFRHYMATEARYDGGKLEYMLDEDGTWIKVTNFISGGYTDTKNGPDSGFIDLEDIWTGNIGLSSAFELVEVDLSIIDASNISFRFAFASDTDPNGEGWYVDAVNFTSESRIDRGSGNFTLNLSEEGTSSWNVLCNDTNGYDTWAVSNYSITFDVTNPVVDFGLNTLSDDTNISQNFVYVNSSIVENNFKNITFNLYNETNSLEDSKWFNDTTRDYTFAGLSDGVYYYNMTVYDSANRVGHSGTRKIRLDTTAPTGSLNTPNDNTYVKDSSQNLTGSFADENGLKEVILFVFNSTGYLVTNPTVILNGLTASVGYVYDFLTDDIFTWFYQVEDTVGNKFNTTSKDLIVDTTLPVINFESGTLSNNTYIANKNIYVNTSIIETNFDNITFRLDDSVGVNAEYTFVNSKRDINWTLLPDDKYNYTVTVWDKAGNVNNTESIVITLDNIVPSLAYDSATENNFVNKSQSNIYVKTILSDVNFANVTYVLSNGTGVVNEATYLTEVGSINWTGLPDGVYEYNVTAYDRAGLSKSLPSRTITLDTVKPLVSFVSPTEADSVSLEQEWIYVNTIASDKNFKEISFNLYDSGDIAINTTIYSTLINDINFSASSENVTYKYDVYVEDFAGNNQSTARRNITLIDITNPSLILTSPQPKNYSYNNSIRLDYEVDDVHIDTCWYSLDGAENVTLPGCGGDSLNVADELYHTIDLFVNDTMGYMNSTSVTFFVNSSLILTPTYQVIRGSSFVDGYIEESVSQIDPSKSFILHNSRGVDNGPDSLQVISKFIDVNTISFENYVSGEPVSTEWSLVVGPVIKAQRGELSYTTESSLDISINTVNLSNSFIVVNNKLNSGEPTKNSEGYWTSEFLDETTIRVTRSGTTSGVLSWQVVDWEGVNVQSGRLNITDTGNSNSAAISNVDLGKSFLISSNNLVGGTDVDDLMIKSEFVDSTTLNFSRVGTHGENVVTWFVVESDLFDIQSGIYSHLENSAPQLINLGYDLINDTRAFDLNSHDNAGTSTSFATASLTQTIIDNNTISLQKGVASGSGESNWFTIEIKDLNSPTISLTSPQEFHNYSDYSIPTFTYLVEDESSVANCSLYGDWNGGWHLNQTVSGDASFNGADVGSSGFYNWAVECFDIYGNSNVSENRTFGAFLPATEPIFYESSQTANDGTGDIILNWSATVDTLEYRIYSGNLANDLTLLDTVTDTNYTDLTFAGNKRRFYKIEAWNPSSANMSTKTIGAHVYTFEHNASGKYSIKDRNWIGFPTNFTNVKTANETLNEIPGLTTVTRYDANSQQRVTCNEFSCPESFSCTPTSCNFDLKAGEGYEVAINSTGPAQTNWSNVGVVYEPQDIVLVYDESGLKFNQNWVSMTAYTTFVKGRGLLDDVGVADAATYWDSNSQASQGLIATGSPFPWVPAYIGEDFDIDMERGYEISITEDKLWRQN